jgi:hypothetical protein
LSQRHHFPHLMLWMVPARQQFSAKSSWWQLGQPRLLYVPRLCVLQAVFVAVLFWAGHTSMQRMHGAMQSPYVEQAPPGWALTHKTTTLQSATVTISKGETAITGSALTATTTTTTGGAAADAHTLESTNQQAAAAAAAAGAAAAVVNVGVSGIHGMGNEHQKVSFGNMLGDLQQGLHALMIPGWRPGSKLTRAQLAAAAAASMQDEGRDIELHPNKVAAVVNRATLAQQQLQALTQQPLSSSTGGAATAPTTQTAEEHSAEAYAVSGCSCSWELQAGARSKLRD